MLRRFRCRQARGRGLIAAAGILCALHLPLSAALAQVPKSAGPAVLEAAVLEVAIFDAINGQRQKHGLEALRWDEPLASIARQTSRNLVNRRRLDHIDLAGQGPSQRVARGHRRLIGLVGENLAAFSGHWPDSVETLAGQMVQGWMDSPGHRKNILRPDYTHSAIGLAAQGRELRCVQLFAAVEAYLTADLPPTLPRTSHLSLSFVDGFGAAPQGVSLEPLGSSRTEARRQAPDFADPQDWTIEAKPGPYRLRFYFRRGERRFAVIDGPTLDVTAASVLVP